MQVLPGSGGGGGGVTLVGAYNYGGSGVGRTINAISGAVVISSSAADNNGLLSLSKTPAGAQTGTVFTITAAPGASAAMVGQSITMCPFTSAAGYALDVAWQPLTGSTNGVVRIAHDGNGSSSGATTLLGLGVKTSTLTLGAAFTAVKIDLESNVIPGSFETTGVNITIPASTSTSSRGVYITTKQTLGAALDVVLNASGSGNTPSGVRVQIAGGGVGDGASAIVVSVPSNNAGHAHFRSTATTQAPVNGYAMFYGDWSPLNGNNGGNPYPVGVHIKFLPTSSYYLNSYGVTTGKGFHFESFPTAPTVGGGNEGGFTSWDVQGIYIDHTPAIGFPATFVTDNFKGVYFSISPASTGTVNVKGIHGIMGSGVSATSYAMDLQWQGYTGATNGIVRVALNASGITSANTTMLNLCSMTPSYGVGAYALTGVRVDHATNFAAKSLAVLTALDVVLGSCTDTTIPGLASTHYGYRSTRNVTLTHDTNFNGGSIYILNAPTVASSGTNIENAVLVEVVHSPVAGSGTLDDRTIGFAVTMTPCTSSPLMTGAKFTMVGTNAGGPAVSIAHGGTNANQLIFTSVANGTGSHIYGPPTGALVVSAGIPTGSANGNGVTINASVASTIGDGGSVTIQAGAAVTNAGAKVGGAISIKPGAGAGGGNRGTLTLCGNTADLLAFFGTTGGVQQTSGANLTNNVTSGGTDNTIDNWTDLTTYATDAAAIRNAIYQLSRKLKQINDGARTYGLYT